MRLCLHFFGLTNFECFGIRQVQKSCTCRALYMVKCNSANSKARAKELHLANSKTRMFLRTVSLTIL